MSLFPLRRHISLRTHAYASLFLVLALIAGATTSAGWALLSALVAIGLGGVLWRRITSEITALRALVQPFKGEDLPSSATKKTEGFGALSVDLNLVIERLSKRQVTIDTILAVSGAVNRERNLEKGLYGILDGIINATHARYAALSVFQADGSLESFYHRGFSDADVSAIGRMPQGRGLLGFIQQNGETVRTSRMQDHSASIGFPEGHPAMESLLAVPIRFGGLSLGNLYLSERTQGPNEFSADDQFIVESIADVVAITIDGYRNGAARQQEREELRGSAEVLLGAMDRIAGGDLTVQLDSHSVADVSMPVIPRLYEGVNRTVEGIAATIRTVRQSVDALAAAAVEMSATVEQIAASTNRQSTQADGVRVAMAEMVATINENSTASMQAVQVAKDNGDLARRGGSVVEQTVGKVREVEHVSAEAAMVISRLGDSSQQIGAITATIADIAEQTNLLALNATIEAARAGTHGRGFAVVAEEVRKLAERTADATRTIENTIQSIQADTTQAVQAINRSREEVSETVSLADQAGQALAQILSATQNAREHMMQIATATEQQSATSSDVAGRVGEISQAAQEAAHGTDQVAAATEELSELAVSLQQVVHRFTLDATHATRSTPHGMDHGVPTGGDGAVAHSPAMPLAIPTRSISAPTTQRSGGCPFGHG